MSKNTKAKARARAFEAQENAPAPSYQAACVPLYQRDRSLQELEGQDWGEPTYFSSLVVECHRLHRVPLRDLTTGDLRRLIGQQIGLRYLVPLALETLALTPWVSGDYYEGDLLQNVIGLPPAFWQEHPDWRAEVDAIVAKAVDEAQSCVENDAWQYDDKLLAALMKWREVTPP